MVDKNKDIENLEKNFNSNITTLKKIRTKISKNEDLDDDEQKFLKRYLNPIKLEKKPPFSIMNLLHYCWAISLVFSGSDDQKKLGVKLSDHFIDFLKRYRMDKVNIEKRVTDSYLVNERFVNDLVGSLSKTIRNVSFVKEVLEKKVNDLDEELVRKTAFYTDLASFSPLSKEGVGTKIITFFGGGTLVSLASSFTDFQNSDFVTKFGRLKELHGIAPKENQTAIFNQATKLVEESSTNSNFDILLFAFAGIGILVLLTLIIKFVRDGRVEKLIDATKEKQKEIWTYEYKPEVAEYITDFYFDIKILIQKYYNDNADEILKEFWSEMEEDSITKVIKVQEPPRKKIEEFIKDKMLPHYWSKHKEE